MQDDGLLSIDAVSLQVMPAGQLLVHTICMVFDRYLHTGNGSTYISKVV
jgi:coproporphyrinogen III oxidase-like Fe-S oxidoreductase